MAKICPIFSGSTGNSTYIATEKTKILVDAGASCKALTLELSKIGADVRELSAIAVTHEHIDHIKGLKTLLKNSGADLIASEETIATLESLDKIPSTTKVVPLYDKALAVGDIAVNRFATSHDCPGSSGYNFILPDSKKISVCTDLGVITDEVSLALRGSYIILLESNHDVDMLKKGPYPPHLKVRILGDKGHISNNICANELKKLYKNGTERFILGHLSQNNNTPILARSAAESALMDLSAVYNKDYILKIAAKSGNGVTVI